MFVFFNLINLQAAMNFKTITPPSVEPVTLAEAKRQCKVDADITDDDTLIDSYIQAARELAEHRTGRLFCTQTIEGVLDAFPAINIPLPVSPVQSVVSVKYIDTNGSEQEVPSNYYTLDTYGLVPSIEPEYGVVWPAVRTGKNAVKVRLMAGYGDAAAVPLAVKQWILMAVDVFYQHRGLVETAQTYELPANFCQGLLDTVKIWRV